MKREGQIQVHSENIFPVIKKWLYSDKDIFLRELVANGCDAIQKLQKLRGIGEAPASENPPRIDIRLNPDENTMEITDNGIGMTEDEVVKYIAQVAFSGAEEFIASYKEKSSEEAGIIGHFGLGFYSAYMVADRVEIDTLSYKEGAKAVRWTSSGETSYELEDSDRQQVGTTILLHLMESEKEFAQEGRIREILRKYCAFMPVEIYLNADQSQPADSQPETEGEDQAKEPPAPHPVNNTHPLWLKAPKDCTDEEYESFYQEVFMDFNKPLFWIHLNVDYPFNLKGILYFPKQSNKVEVMPGEIKLYCNQVYVADNIKEVVPEFLMLLKGVIDCPDLPLNVSRSFLQNDGDVAKISRHITKKVSDKLHSIFNSEREKYEQYWDDISPFIKFGCIKDPKFYERVKDILLFESINGGYLTLADCPKQNDKIFYVSDKNMQAQYIRMFKDNSLDAVILDHAIDSHFISFLEYTEKDMKFTRIDSDLGDALKDGESGEGELPQEEKDKLVEQFKSALGQAELEVKAERLKNTNMPAVMLLSEYSRRMQDMGKMYGEMFSGMKPEVSVVLNLENPVVKKLPSLSGDEAKLVSQQIYDLAMLGHKTLSADELSAFIDRSVQLLEQLAAATEEK